MTTFFFLSPLHFYLFRLTDENKTEVKVMKVRTLKYPYSGGCYSVAYRLLKPTQNLFFGLNCTLHFIFTSCWCPVFTYSLLNICIYTFLSELHFFLNSRMMLFQWRNVVAFQRLTFSSFFFNLKQYIALLYSLLVNVAVLHFTLLYYCLLFHLYSLFDAKSKDSLLLSMTYSS